MGNPTKKLVLVLDLPHYMEKKLRQPLAHDGGKILKMCLARLSIPRESWVHTYCYQGDKEELPKKKQDRLDKMAPDLLKAKEFIRLNQPCVVLGLGRIACEFLTGASIISTRAGTCWKTPKYGKVWITNSPDAALFDPGMVVDIYGVIAKAAEAANIPTKFDPTIPLFDWSEYV